MSRHLCNKCGRSMDYPDDHSTTAGCLTPYPITVEYPLSMPDAEFRKLHHAERTEDARRLARYDEAIRLLRLAKFEKEHWHEADAFLAAEPKEGDMETRPTGIPHYLRDSRLRSNGMREAAEIVRNFRPASACSCGNYSVPHHQPGCLVGECLEIANEIEASAGEKENLALGWAVHE